MDQIKSIIRAYPILFILSIGAFLFIPHLGSVHLFDWDEVNFAEITREMIETGNYMQPQINYLPFYEKPPLFMWMQACAMQIFGINEFSSRLPNALFGIIILISLFQIGRKHFSVQFGWLWVLSFGASIAPHFYFRTGLIDPIFNFFIFLSLYYALYLFQYKDLGHKKTLTYTFLSAAFCALAIMTKGPVALIIIVGTLFLACIFSFFKSMPSIAHLFLWGIVTISLSSIWFLYEFLIHGNTYIYEFITYQIRLFQTEDAKHGGTILFHPVALLLGCFPASIFMWSAFVKRETESVFQKNFFQLMLACFVVVLVLFSIVQTKIIHYSSMDYYPMTFFAAWGLDRILRREIQLSIFQKIGLLFISLFWGILLFVIPYLGIHKEEIIPYIHDKNFLHQLEIPIQWDLYASAFGIIFIALFAIAMMKFKGQKIRTGFIILSIAIIFLIQVLSYYYLPRIEKMVQGELIQFCQSHKKESADHVALFLKSYAIFFYSDVKPFVNKEDSLKHLYYLYLPIERDVYIYTRTIDRIHTDTGRIPNLQYLYGKGGFEFYKRTKQ